MTDLDQDILYMRRLAEQGRRGFISGGLFLASAGLVFGLASLAQWALSRGQLPAALQAWLWPGTFILYAAIWLGLFLRLRVQKQPLAANASHAAFSALWMGCAAGILVSVAAIAIVAHATGIAIIQSLYTPVTLSFYGVAWFVVGFLAQRKWMHLVAVASFVSALALACLAGDPRQLLVLGAALLLTLTVPGLKLVFEEPR